MLLDVDNVVIYKYRRWNRRLIWDLCFLLKHLFPFMSTLQRLWIGCIGNDYASCHVPCVQRLKSRLRIHI